MLQGSINHVSVTVSDLTAAMTFFGPLLEFLGYVVDRSDSTMVRVNVSPVTGGAVNVWQASEQHRHTPFQVYAPGLHHIAFNLASRDAVDRLAELVPAWGGRITDPPGEYPFTDRGSYYAVYFRGPDDIKLECVHMSELERLHREAGSLHRRLWPHDSG